MSYHTEFPAPFHAIPSMAQAAHAVVSRVYDATETDGATDGRMVLLSVLCYLEGDPEGIRHRINHSRSMALRLQGVQE